MSNQPLIQNDHLQPYYQSMSSTHSTSDQVVIHVVSGHDDNSKPNTNLLAENSVASSDDLPRAPSFVRQKSKEEVKQEVEAILPLAPSFRRQRSFDHTLRPAPFLAEQRESEFQRVLRGMGFSEGDIQQALKDGGDKAIEDIVRELVEKKEKEPKEEVKETKSDEPDGDDDVPSEPLTLLVSNSYIATDWKCRYCGDHVNSMHTEVCIQCGRARALCEELSSEAKKEREEKEAQRKQEDAKHALEVIRLYEEQQQILEKLELGPWPCRFCDAISPGDYFQCKHCLSSKYLTRVLLTNEEWMSRLMGAQEEEKKSSQEDAQYQAEWEKKKASGGTVECLICFDDVPVKSMVFASCKHNFCVTCWNGYLETRVKDGDVLKLNCPAPKCRRAVERQEIKARLNSEMWEKFNKFYTQAQLSLNPNTRWCPTPDCETVMIGSKEQARLSCPKCQHEICFRCNHDWHTGTCERAARGLVGLAADRATFAAYAMVANIKPCPQCRAPIAKDDGCNHMTCQRCHYEFCWMCRGRYNSNHFAPWNLLGCPGGQAGCLACLGDDRCFCIDCGCGCGLLGFVKRCLLKILFIACGLACCPCVVCLVMANLFDDD